ncbi:type VI secretion system baseplate subunit TssE [Paraburkholderia sp. BL21I4N1]|uniref:type VI secretion system baseplate subunit TssE n=1 Tax=Paraburkholderia sp. BL21I4N1 TaxID=1938801 RepID=UPI000D3F96DF|nr:GPW/gp25 family protein [Paraburkholderia sp. BL21I4N1]PQV48777.1 type VI secretion system protein ImpF [Paraburkholderia sp. BL21I4N1]
MLLDRLTAHRSPASNELGGRYAPSHTALRTALRESILRDLGWLMNSVPLDATDNLNAYPHVHRSVINFGMNAVVGSCTPVNGWTPIESAIREAITQFEPRILADSIEVRCVAGSTAVRPGHTLPLEISGELWVGDSSQAFVLRSQIDLENGRVTLRSPGIA